MKHQTETISSAEIEAWLVLLHANGIGLTRLQRLLNVFDSVTEIVAASRSQLKAIPGIGDKLINAICHPNKKRIDNCLRWLEKPQHHFIPLYSVHYPALLAATSDAPIALFVHGNKDLLQQPQIAMVGSRNPDQYGKEKACDFAVALANCGITVTSGLALGIDAAAHRGALAAGGDTIAVVATGIDRVYPPQHKKLAQQIVENGCLVSEQILGCPPKAGLFPRRNRIISGLSLGCLVLQASLRSGSLITARSAMEQGREVFALPGSINNPLSKGCHQLIRQGANLIETIDEILIELKEILSRYIENSNKFTLPQNNEIMMRTSENVDAGVKLALDHSIDQDAIDDIVAFDSNHERGKAHKRVKNHEPEEDHGPVNGHEHVENHGRVIAREQVTSHELYKQMLLQYLQYESATIDALVDCCELSTSIVSSVLQELELQGEVSLHGGRYTRIQRRRKPNER